MTFCDKFSLWCDSALLINLVAFFDRTAIAASLYRSLLLHTLEPGAWLLPVYIHLHGITHACLRVAYHLVYTPVAPLEERVVGKWI